MSSEPTNTCRSRAAGCALRWGVTARGDALADHESAGFEEIRDFVMNEAATLTRLDVVLGQIGQQVRERASVGLDRASMWNEVERRLGWTSTDHDGAAGPEGK